MSETVAGAPFRQRMPLSDVDKAILAFEREHPWWKFDGNKEQAIRETFDLSATRYYQRLNRIIDDPEAYMADPTTVNRLQRLRAQRQTARSVRRLQAH
ncbi:MAG: hypothetical protein JWM93_2427 [Frankiales bacterium]|nr:hypothetical protein [Frankiales bacterium]